MLQLVRIPREDVWRLQRHHVVRRADCLWMLRMLRLLWPPSATLATAIAASAVAFAASTGRAASRVQPSLLPRDVQRLRRDHVVRRSRELRMRLRWVLHARASLAARTAAGSRGVRSANLHPHRAARPRAHVWRLVAAPVVCRALAPWVRLLRLLHCLREVALAAPGAATSASPTWRGPARSRGGLDDHGLRR